MKQEGFARSIISSDPGRLVLSVTLAAAFHASVFIFFSVFPRAQEAVPSAPSVIEVSITRTGFPGAGNPPIPSETEKREGPVPDKPQYSDPPSSLAPVQPVAPERTAPEALPEMSLNPGGFRPDAEPFWQPSEESAPKNGVGAAGGTAALDSPQPGGGALFSETGLPDRNARSLSEGRTLPLPEYPAQARRFGYQGTVKVAITIKPDGSISGVEIMESSGYTVLDREAVNTVKRRWSFNPPGREVRIVKEFEFSLSM